MYRIDEILLGLGFLLPLLLDLGQLSLFPMFQSLSLRVPPVKSMNEECIIRQKQTGMFPNMSAKKSMLPRFCFMETLEEA